MLAGENINFNLKDFSKNIICENGIGDTAVEAVVTDDCLDLYVTAKSGKLDENDLTALNSKYGEVTGTECADNVEVYYRWGNSYTTCTATAMCTLCGKKVATETVNSVQNADGSYTATFTNTLLGTKTYKKTTT